MDIYAQVTIGNTDDFPYGDATYQIIDEAAGGVIAYCHLAGVCSCDSLPAGHTDAIMAKVPVTGIWGIAAWNGKKLNAIGIFTIADLKAATPSRCGRNSRS
jgi:hypothetical protein